MSRAAAPESRPPSSDPIVYPVVAAPLCSVSKVIPLAILFFSAAAIVTLFVIEKGMTPYVYIPTSTGGLAVMTLLFNTCFGKKAPSTYVQIKGEPVALPNVLRVEKDGTYVVPGDGNCLFHSSLASLTLLGKKEVPVDHLALRKQVVKWMKDNLASNSVLRKELYSSLHSFYEAKIKHAQEDQSSYVIAHGENSPTCKKNAQLIVDTQKIIDTLNAALGDANFLVSTKPGQERPLLKTYFDEMQTSGTFGTNAEIYALSEIYQVKMDTGVSPYYGEQYANNGIIVFVFAKNHYNFKAPSTSSNPFD